MNEIENKKKEKINETQSCLFYFLKKISKIQKPIARLAKGKKKKKKDIN